MVFNGSQTADPRVHVSEILSTMKPLSNCNQIDFKMGSIHKNRVKYLAGFGAVLVLLGVFLGWSGFDLIISARINRSIVLEEGSDALARFQKTPFPLDFKVFLFNVTNPDDVMIGGKPKLHEIGPYFYDLYREKPELKFLEDGTIEYNMSLRYVFNQEKSGALTEMDVITVLNVPLVGTAGMVERTFPMGLGFLNKAIPFLFPNIADIFVTASIGDLLFNGLTIQCNYTSGPAMPICNGLKGRVPPSMWRDEETKHYKFAIFRHKNITKEGPYRVKTGADDVSQIGQIIEYQHKNNLTVWDKNSTCSIIQGTDTTIFSPPKNPRDDLRIFVPDVCLSFSASYTSSAMYHGIPVNKYFSSQSNMASAEELPENACRCYKDDDGVRHCLKSGLIDSTPCQGVPVIFSNPHFLDADPEYQNGVVGLKPIEDIHKTFILLEPRTGAPVEGRKRMQMNLILKPIKDIPLLHNVTTTIFPILWIEEGLTLEGPLLSDLETLFHVMNLFDTFKWVIIGAGLFVGAFAFVLFLKLRRVACFSPSTTVSPVVDNPSTVGQKMNTFGVTNRGSDDYRGNSIYPQLATGQNKGGELVSASAVEER